MSKGFLLATLSIAIVFRPSPFYPGPQSQSSAGCDNCAIVAEAMTSLSQLQNGDSRLKAEQEFQLDGGLHTAQQGTYVYQKCHTIKVDIQFTGQEVGTKPGFLPSDKIIGISRPYLESPFYD